MTAEYKIRISEAPNGTWTVEVLAPDGSVVKSKSGLGSDGAIDVGTDFLKCHLSQWRTDTERGNISLLYHRAANGSAAKLH